MGAHPHLHFLLTFVKLLKEHCRTHGSIFAE